jgi:hypothetical protein
VTFSKNSQLRTAYELRPKQHTGGVKILGDFVSLWRWATVAGLGHHPLSLPVPHAHLLQRRRVAQGCPVPWCPPRRINPMYYRGVAAASAPPPAGPS